MSTCCPQAQRCVFNDSPVIHLDRSSGCAQHPGQGGSVFRLIPGGAASRKILLHYLQKHAALQRTSTSAFTHEATPTGSAIDIRDVSSNPHLPTSADADNEKLEPHTHTHTQRNHTAVAAWQFASVVAFRKVASSCKDSTFTLRVFSEGCFFVFPCLGKCMPRGNLQLTFVTPSQTKAVAAFLANRVSTRTNNVVV